MHRFNILVFVNITLLFLGCKNNQQISSQSSELHKIIINTVSKSSRNPLETLVLSKKIKLETNANCLIGNIKSIKIINSNVFILQSTSAQTSLLRFDSSGSFINKIANYGRGPGEILDIRDYIIEGSLIEILTNLKISLYTIDGEFVKEVLRTPFPGVGFFKQNGYYYIFHSVLKPYTITKLNSKGSIITYFLQNKYIDAISGNDKVNTFKDNISLFSAVRDTIYCFADDNINPLVILDTKNMLSASKAYKKSKDAMMFIDELNNKNDYCTINNYFENENLIIIIFYYKRKGYLSIYNKKTKNSETILASTVDKITDSQYCNPVCLTDDNHLIFPVLDIEKKLINSEDYNNPELCFYKIIFE